MGGENDSDFGLFPVMEGYYVPHFDELLGLAPLVSKWLEFGSFARLFVSVGDKGNCCAAHF